MTSVALLLSAVLLTAACDFQVISNGGNGTGTGGGGTGTGGGGGTPTTPTPIPNPNPNPSPNPGNRTPDPPVGSVLPMPGYAESVVSAVPGLSATSCQSGSYLDTVVLALQAFDTRWGYQCKDASCATLSNDRIAYHATAGPDVRGATGVYTVDIIGSACENPAPAWFPDGYNGALAFTPRRF